MQKKMLIAALFLVTTALSVNAQSKDEAAVAAAVDKLKQAMIDGNRTELEKYAADKLSYGHSGGALDDRKQFVEKIASGQSDFVTIDLSEQTISISGNAAVVRHVFRAKTNDGGKPGEVNLRILLVWQKQKGQWKLLARQAVKIAQ